jgi:superfamily II DNA helicase RecQ
MSESRAFEVGFDRPNLTYEVVLKNKKEHPKQLGELIEARFRGQSGIIYCLSKVGARSQVVLSFDA